MSEETLLMQISANTGPEECCLAVRHVLSRVGEEAKRLRVQVDVLESVPGREAGNFRSVLLGLQGSAAAELVGGWCGTVQWICPSPYRPRHGRKNWFVGVQVFDGSASGSGQGGVLNDAEVRFEALRSGGPGGQHVNTTDSAVRATHLPSGISVKVQTERSQHANKRLARALLLHKLAAASLEDEAKARRSRWQQHWTVERGNAKRSFFGADFVDR